MKSLELARQYSREMVEIRRRLHRRPELSNEEFETTALVKQQLAARGIETVDIGMKTGVVAVLRGGRPGKVIALRGDMDALPMQEETNLPFASEFPGKCHACGHDIHTTVLLYTAQVLSTIREDLCGSVLFLFQPAEEGGGGARQMVEHGVFDILSPDMIVGLHTSASYPVGSVAVIKGPASASSDNFEIAVTGKGGHGGHPDRCVDPILICAHIITQLQTIVARETEPNSPAVLTIGSIHSGHAPNVIPNRALMQGTLRTLDPAVRERAIRSIARITRSCAEALRGTAQVAWSANSVPVRINDGTVIDHIVAAAEAVVGPENIHTIPRPSLGSEDIAEFFPRFAPGAQFFLGTANDSLNSRLGAHNSKNIFDEGCLEYGTAMLVQIVREYLTP